MRSPMQKGAPSFQFYKVRLKHAIPMIKPGSSTISILQSSIKTKCKRKERRQPNISILQSSIKTFVLKNGASFRAVFQFYKVRLKLPILPVSRYRNSISILQSSIKTISGIVHRLDPVRFQFYKVRLKHGNKTRALVGRRNFNSTKFD